MIKQRMKAVVLIILLAIIGIVGGCKKCYKCRPLDSFLICRNATDTFTVSCLNKREAIDSINYYESRGYNVDTIYMAHYSINEYKICGMDAYNSSMYKMDSCGY